MPLAGRPLPPCAARPRPCDVDTKRDWTFLRLEHSPRAPVAGRPPHGRHDLTRSHRDLGTRLEAHALVPPWLFRGLDDSR